jgi:hypothetical protein
MKIPHDEKRRERADKFAAFAIGVLWLACLMAAVIVSRCGG